MTTTQKIKNCCLIAVLFLFSFSLVKADHATWNGSVSKSWEDNDNWSTGKVPSSNDTVTIETGSNDVNLDKPVTVKMFTMSSGLLDMQTYDLMVTSKAVFQSGEILNGNVIVTGTGSVTFSGTVFTAKVRISSNSIFLNGSVFNDSLLITKKGKSNDMSKGGNTFNEPVVLIDSAEGSLVLADSVADIFNSHLIVTNTSEGSVYLAHRAESSQFNDDVYLNGSNIYSNYYGTANYDGNIIIDSPDGDIFFGVSGGSCTQIYGKKISTPRNFISDGILYLRNFTSLDSLSMFSLELKGTGRLVLESGTVFHDSVNFTASELYLNGATFNDVCTFKNTGSVNVTSTGGCTFAKAMTLTSNGGPSTIYSLSNTAGDTYNGPAYFENKSGTFSLNNGLFKGKCTFRSNTTTGEGFYVAGAGNCTFKDSVVITQLLGPGMFFGGGNVVLDSSSNLCFSSGIGGSSYFQKLTRLGSTPINILDGPDNLNLGQNNTFQSNFSFTGKSITLYENVFYGTTTIKVHGGTTSSSYGGNVFHGATLIQDSSSTAHSMYLAIAAPDDYNDDVTFVQKGTGVSLYPAYTKNSTFAKNIMIDGTTSMQMGGNGGKVILDGTTAQSITRGNTALIPTIKKLQINKSSNSITLNSPLTISDSLILTKGRINSDTTNFISMLHGSKLSGGSDSSYVNGPMKKVGNSAFVFPLGSSTRSHPYHPLGISAPAASTDEFKAIFNSDQQLFGTIVDTSIDNLFKNTYWSLTHDVGTSKVAITLYWNNEDSVLNPAINPTDMRVTGYDGTKWKDLRFANSSGIKRLGSVSSLDSITTISNFTLAFRRCSALMSNLTTTNISCHDAFDGKAGISVLWGTKPYIYVWSNGMGDQTETPAILSAGNYIVNFKDSINCQIIDTVTISEPDEMLLNFISTPSSCLDSTGSISVSVTGGSGVIKHYYWAETKDTTYVISNLPSGNYSVLVTDSNNCSVFGKVNISDSSSLAVSLSIDTAIACYSNKGGYAEIVVSGGMQPYSISWSGMDSDTGKFMSNIFAGEYVVKVKDSIGCLLFDTVVFTQPDTFKVDMKIINASCPANNDGIAISNVSGGTSPYNFLWYSSININNDSLVNRPSGFDTLRITDSNGCTIYQTFEILNTGSLSASAAVLSIESCFNDSTASAKVDVIGGTVPYTYSWYPSGGNNDTATGLLSNFYIVTVIDNNGCRTKDSLFITGPDNISTEIHKTMPTSDIEDDGSAVAIVVGGKPPYTYLWNSGSTSSKAYDLGWDADTLIIQDANGCIDSAFYRTRGPNIVIGACNYTNTPDDVSSCTFTPPAITPTISMDITDFGADGTDGESDECAFELAAQYFSSLDSAIIKILTISQGTYYIGKQDAGLGMYWLQGHNVLSFSNVRNLTIIGEVDQNNNPISILKLNPCMKHGAFSPATGQRHIGYVWIRNQTDPVLAAATVTSNNYNICATVGDMIYLNYCNRIRIQDIELDGNISETVIGGGFTEGMQQLDYSGITLNAAKNVVLENVYVHHFGYDGLAVRDRYCPNDPAVDLNAVGLNLVMNNCKFTYNCRNNVTWAGGYKLTANACKFYYAGQSRYTSKPGAGLDIEYEPYVGAYGYPNSNGTFNDCEFGYNYYYGMINDVHADPPNTGPNFPPTRNMHFNHCTFIGDYYSIQNSGKQVVFDNCTFVGSVSSHYGELTSFSNSRVRGDQTKFRNSRFLEFWNVQGGGMRSFQQTVDDQLTCPIGGHGYLLGVQGPRTEFFNSYVVTNYSMRGAYMTTDAVGGIPLQWWNKFQFNHVNFYSHGLNECGCENGAELSVFQNVNLSTTNGQSAHWIRHYQYLNAGPTCIGGLYGSQFQDITASYVDLVTSIPGPMVVFPTAQFIPLPPQGNYPSFPKYLQTYLSDRLEWPDLFSYDSLNPALDTYSDYTSMCVDPPERKKQNINESNISKDLNVFPTPCQNYATLTGEEGSHISIKNLLGETIKIINLENKSYTIQIDEMRCGLYLVSDQNGNVAKLIIAR